MKKNSQPSSLGMYFMYLFQSKHKVFYLNLVVHTTNWFQLLEEFKDKYISFPKFLPNDKSSIPKKLLYWINKPKFIVYFLNLSMCLTEIFSKSRLLETSEWRSHICFVVRVDKDGSSIQVVRYIHGFVDVGGEDARCQAILCTIGTLQHAINIPVSHRVKININ